MEQQAQALRVLAPSAQLERVRERLEERLRRLRAAIETQFAKRTRSLQHCQDQLRALGPEQTLSRGYSLLLDEKGRVVSSAEKLKPKQSVTLRLHDGERGATIDT